ncbi:pyroglutamyl-peptidase I [Methylovirgula sp. HY1]|uniref:pyroglutamyl-peptidase I n=1 Tax=Methylovirgula sp. HY1 TaxID=2822761 RepID=UPI001C5BAF29|nr:pyroglutamyl-peptidase I [Methylovirgula sp. HY1]QXX73620.1 Pyrrolidone-carboxylate peptidase [Methylovirgula sp. HY1]
MIKILVTGFGGFPGAHHNPSLTLLTLLPRKRARLARLGIALELRALPVVYAGLGPRLAQLAAELRPDAILHFGLAGRRKIISLETRARNRVNPLHPDAHGARPRDLAVLPGAPHIVPTRLPTRQILSAWRRAGIASGLSNDAGDYLCNATLYHSLVAQSDATCVGFIHIPHPRRHASRPSQPGRKPPRLTDIGVAAEMALVIIATAARQKARLRKAACQPRSDAGADLSCTGTCVTIRSAPGFSP